MKFAFGLFLLISSIIACILFIYCSLDLLWIIVLIPLSIVAITLVISPAEEKIAAIEKRVDRKLEQLKATGQKVKPDFDKCEFKDSSYAHQVTDTNLSALSAHGGEVMTTENVNQSVIIYHHSDNETFTQPFPCSRDALKFYVLNNNITLYVNSFDRTNYFFDLNI